MFQKRLDQIKFSEMFQKTLDQITVSHMLQKRLDQRTVPFMFLEKTHTNNGFFLISEKTRAWISSCLAASWRRWSRKNCEKSCLSTSSSTNHWRRRDRRVLQRCRPSCTTWRLCLSWRPLAVESSWSLCWWVTEGQMTGLKVSDWH